MGDGDSDRPSPPLVLSIFPGIDLLGMAFEEEGWTVVRGPDPLWGGDIRRFRPPAGVFDGVIGGPPCQVHPRLRFLNPLAGKKHGDLIPEFCRVVAEAAPRWFLMENVPEAPLPEVEGYSVRVLLLNNRWLTDGEQGVGAEQQRVRRFSFGTEDGRALDISPDIAVFEAPLTELAVTASRAEPVPVRLQRAPGGGHVLKKRLRPPTVSAGHGDPLGIREALGAVPGRPRASPRAPTAVLSGHGGVGEQAQDMGLTTRSLAEMCRLQGLPEDFLAEAPFTMHGKRRVVGNGVPLPTGRAVARAIGRALA